MIRRPRIFYGWWIAAANLGIMFVSAGIGFYSFGILLKPLMNEFGWSRGITSLAHTIFMLGTAAGSLLVGKLIGRYGVKKIILIGSLVGGIGYILLSQTHNIWYLYIFYALVGAGFGGGAGNIPAGVLVSNWFSRKIGVAMGISMVGLALGAAILVPSIGLVIASFGWRAAYIFMGSVVLFINIPLALFVFKQSPAEMGLHPDGDEPPEVLQPDASKADAAGPVNQTGSPEASGLKNWLKRPSLWFLCLGFCLACIGQISILTHEVAFLTDIGIPATVAAVALGFTGGMGAVGKITFGWLTSRFSVRYVAMSCFALQLVGVFILMNINSMAMVWLFVIFFGFSMGGFATLMPLATEDIFGKANFAMLFAFVFMVVIGAGTVGPPLAGFIHDATGSYSIAFSIFAATYFTAIVITYFAWGTNPRPIKSRRRI